MRGTMQEPQANLGENQKFSPGRLKTRKGGLSKIRVDMKKNETTKKKQSRACY